MKQHHVPPKPMPAPRPPDPYPHYGKPAEPEIPGITLGKVCRAILKTLVFLVLLVTIIVCINRAILFYGWENTASVIAAASSLYLLVIGALRK